MVSSEVFYVDLSVNCFLLSKTGNTSDFIDIQSDDVSLYHGLRRSTIRYAAAVPLLLRATLQW